MKTYLQIILAFVSSSALLACQAPSARPATDYQPDGGYTNTTYEPLKKSNRTYESDSYKKSQEGLPERSYGSYEYDPNAGK